MSPHKKQKRGLKEETKYIPTSLNWYPTIIKNGKPVVKVGLHFLETGEWRINMWGDDDDHGIERFFPDYRTAKDYYDSIKKVDAEPEGFIQA